jgi:phenylpropionate dioxygenase-like ring-hydroxylating dioxygenase large terminal subunit
MRRMARERELSLGDEIAAAAAQGPPPAIGPATSIPTSIYTDPERHAREVAAMRRRPVAVVASSELASPGDFVTARVAGIPVVVARSADRAVTASVNACAHRGSTVETRECGSARIFSCDFHGWSYELDGSLRSVAEAATFSSEPVERGLRRLAAEERHGIVWVTPGVGAGEALGVAEWLGPELDELVEGLGSSDLAAFTSTELELACNWKMLTDGFLETYHLKYLHRNSIAPYFPSNLMVIRPFEGADTHLGGSLPKNRLLKQFAELPRHEWQVLDHITMAVVLVPGTVLQWQAGHLELFSIRPHPTEPSRCTCRLTLMVPADRLDEDELWKRNWERVVATIPGEDFRAAEDVQANIDAGAVTELRLGGTEHALSAHLASVDRLLSSTR